MVLTLKLKLEVLLVRLLSLKDLLLLSSDLPELTLNVGGEVRVREGVRIELRLGLRGGLTRFGGRGGKRLARDERVGQGLFDRPVHHPIKDHEFARGTAAHPCVNLRGTLR